MNNSSYNLTNNDQDNIKNLLNVTNLMFDIYSTICALEINNAINSRQFNEQIERLKLIHITEQNYYNDLCSTQEQNQEVINFIRKTYNYDKNASIFIAKKEDIIIKRILYKLETSLMYHQFFSLFKTKNLDFSSFKKRSNCLAYLINMSIEDDINRCSLYFLQHKINNNYFRQELIEDKYKIIFYTIGNDNIIEQYIFNDPIYLSTNLFCSLYGISDNVQKAISEQYLTNEYYNILNHINSKDDINLVQKSEIIKTTILLCRLKASLCLLDIKTYEKLYQQYQQIKIKNSISKKLIDEAFNINREAIPIHKFKFKI